MGSVSYLADYFQLANDIPAGFTQTHNWNSGAGFMPVGSGVSNPFTGNFDGKGYSITGLYINNNSLNYLGLFGYISSGANISHVGLINGSVTGANSASIGNLVGWNDGGAVSYSFSNQTVTLTGTDSGTGGIGGLVGVLNGGSISNSYFTGHVINDAGGNAGGLVGLAEGGSSISDSYASGTVTGGGSAGKNGGLIGNADGVSVTNSYATGTVTGSGTDVSGGFVGDVTGGTNTFTDNYAAVLVNGSGTKGGFTGANGGITSYSYNFWDTQVSTQNNAIGSSGGSIAGQIIGETTAAMQDQSTYTTGGANWDFTNTWVMLTPNSYPSLLGTLDVWTAAAPGNWSDTTNWSFGVPVAGTYVVFDSASTQDSTIDAGFAGTVAGIFINNGYTGTITNDISLTDNGIYQQSAGDFQC